MTFEEFQKNINENVNPDKAYKLYLQIKLSILEEVMIAHGIINRGSLEKVEKKVLDALADELNKSK